MGLDCPSPPSPLLPLVTGRGQGLDSLPKSVTWLRTQIPEFTVRLRVAYTNTSLFETSDGWGSFEGP